MKICFPVPRGLDVAGASPLVINIARGDGVALAPHIGELVLLFADEVAGPAMALGLGRFAGMMETDGAPAKLSVIIADGEMFAQPQSLPEIGAQLHDYWRGIDDTVFADVTGMRTGGFAEAAATFDVGLDVLGTITQQVLEAYDHRCALTGTDTDLVATPIRTLAQGGAAQSGNLIAMSATAADAFAQFHLTIGDNLEIIVDLTQVTPELIEQLNTNGRMTEARQRAARPATEALVWHRQQFFSRTGLG